MKKWLVFLCILSLLFAIAPAAADEVVYTEGYFYYTISGNSITITGYFGKESVVTVPASIAGIPVNTIAPNVFAGTSVQILYLPDTIMELGENATGTAEVRFIGLYTEPPRETAHIPTATPTAVPTAIPTVTPSLTPTAIPTATPTATPSLTPTAATPSESTSTPAATAEPTGVTDSTAPVVTATATPAPATSVPEPSTTAAATVDVTATAAPDATATPDATVLPTDERSTDPDKSGQGMPVWAWVLIGAAVLIGVAGALTAALRKRKQ